MVPSYDPELNLVYIGTSVTSPAPKFMIGGVENTHLYHNSTLALNADTGEIAWFYQHLNDHWDLDHPYERLLVDTAMTPDPEHVSWINPRLRRGETYRVVTGIPGKTGVVYTLDRATGGFLWATPTTAQNVITHIDGSTGAVTENPELIFTRENNEMLICPSFVTGGKDWEAGAYSPVTNMMYFPLRNACARMLATADGSLYNLSQRIVNAPAPIRSAPSGPSTPPPARPPGSTNSAPAPRRSSPPREDSSSAATATGGSGPWTTRPATFSGRSISARR